MNNNHFIGAKRDLNPYGENHTPSNVRVCQFRHSRDCRTSCNVVIISQQHRVVNSFLKKVSAAAKKTVDLMLKRKNIYLTTVKHKMPAYLIMK